MEPDERTPVQQRPDATATFGTHLTSGLKSSRHTVYRRTPGSRRLGLKRTQARQARTPPPLEKLSFAGLLKTTWHLYKLSPLHRIGTSVSKLKSYSRQFSMHLESEQRSGVAIASDDVLPDKAEFSLYKGLKVTAADPEAIQILLKAKVNNGTSALSSRIILTAYLCSIEREDALPIQYDDQFTYYPFMMVKGTVKLVDMLLDWLRVTFDCSVSPLTFSSLDLTWMVAMWSGRLAEAASSKPVELMYCLPAEVDGLKKITVNIKAHDMKDVWDCIHDHDSNEMITEEVTQFIHSLENHFYQIFRIKISSLHLAQIGTAIAYVSSEGRLKLFSEDHALDVLRHINELSLEQFSVATLLQANALPS